MWGPDFRFPAPTENVGVMVCIWNPGIAGEDSEADGDGCPELSAQSTQSVSTSFMERPCLKG